MYNYNNNNNIGYNIVPITMYNSINYILVLVSIYL